MNKKYKIRKVDGWWYVFGHTGGGHYHRLSGRLSTHLTALAVVSLRESQSKAGLHPAYRLDGEHHAEPTG